MKKLIFTLPILLFVFNAFAQQIDPYPKKIDVTGSAEMEIVPDEIYVVVDLREYEKRGQSKTDIETIKSAFLKGCKETGLADSVITIFSYGGSNNPWLKKKKKADLYASISYQIKFSNARDMDKLVDKLDDDATQNFRIVRMSHSKIIEFRKQLKMEAVKAAKDKATYLVEAINEKLGEAVEINEPRESYLSYDNNNVAVMNTMSQRRYTASDDSDTDGTPDFRKIKLRFELNVVFALK